MVAVGMRDALLNAALLNAALGRTLTAIVASAPRASNDWAWYFFAGRTGSQEQETGFRIAWATVIKRCRKVGDCWVAT